MKDVVNVLEFLIGISFVELFFDTSALVSIQFICFWMLLFL